MSTLAPAVRLYLLAVIACGALAASAVLATSPLALTGNTLVLMAVGAAVGSREVKIGHRIGVFVSHPFVFAGLLIDGPAAALLVALVNLIGATLLKRPRMKAHEVFFNLATGALSAAAAGATYALMIGPQAQPTLQQEVAPLLASSLAYFAVNSWTVAVIVGLHSRIRVLRAWTDHALWACPSFPAGASLGLLTAHLLRAAGPLGGPLTVLLALPFCYVIYSSYRMYLDRLEERKRRLELMERVNAELEAKVRERTEDLLQLNQQLQGSNRQLAENSRLKSEFLANVSHELRTPLNAIIGFSELLDSEAFGPLGTEQREFIADIHGSGQNLLALINDILDLSKIEAGKMSVSVEECDAGHLLRDAVSMVRILAHNKQLALTVTVEPDLPPLEADAFRLKQVLWNLLSNAIKFTPEGGGIDVRVDRHGAGLRFAVADTGIGIPAQAIPRLFEPFYQVDGSHARHHAGTGLGLALVKRFVDLHRGQVLVESEPGRGSCFAFVVPCRPSAPPDHGARASVEVESAEVCADSSSLEQESCS